MAVDPADQVITDVLRGLCYPLRRQILRLMAHDPTVRSPTQVAEILNEPLGVVAYHVRILHRYKLLQRNGHRKARGAVEHFYKPADGALALLEVLETSIREYQS